MSNSPTRVLLVNPRFIAPSFWNYVATCEAAGARYPAAPLGLITVAAMLPKHWDVRFIDRNTSDLDEADIDRADLVMTTGMLPQQTDILEIIRLCRNRNKPLAIGGPSVTSAPELYAEADFQILGEAENVIDQFVAAWSSGQRKGVFTAEKFTVDVTQSPVPRFDLLDFKNYLNLAVQFSRGCPFKCEFCDIIELYGRVPRAKTTQQMLAELDCIHALGYRGHVDFVDDNFIGNKKAVKQFLPHLIDWQQKHGYPFEFSTEASVNIADDDELLALMRKSNFFVVFVGIESPDDETLVATQKKQNTRRNLTDRIHKIYAAGMFVNAGFIVGFDTERGSIAGPMKEAVEATAIPVCMVGLMYALPNTQLTRRLKLEGRLHDGFGTEEVDEIDQCTAGLNFETLRPRRDVLSDYVTILEAIYDVDAYFERVRRVGRRLDRPAVALAGQLKTAFIDLYRLARVIWMIPIRHPALRGPFWRTFFDCVRHNPAALKSVIGMMALYLHLGPFSRYVVARIKEQIAEIDAGTCTRPGLQPTGSPMTRTPNAHLEREQTAASLQ